MRPKRTILKNKPLMISDDNYLVFSCKEKNELGIILTILKTQML